MIEIAAVVLFLFVMVIVVAHFRKQKFKHQKLVLRNGKKSVVYFLYDKSNGNVKFGRATNFDRRYKTHLTSNRDLIVMRVYQETETFNETLIKRKYGQNEWVPLTDALKLTIASGVI